MIVVSKVTSCCKRLKFIIIYFLGGPFFPGRDMWHTFLSRLKMTDGKEKDEFPLNLYPVLFCDEKTMVDKRLSVFADLLQSKVLLTE